MDASIQINLDREGLSALLKSLAGKATINIIQPDEDFITIEEMAKFSGFKKSSLISFNSRKIFPFYKLGQKTFYKKSEIIALMDRISPVYEDISKLTSKEVCELMRQR